jgi:hypothetical protein
VDAETTVDAITDDLSNYGGHLPVVITCQHGGIFQPGVIETRDHRGEVVVTIQIGERIA